MYQSYKNDLDDDALHNLIQLFSTKLTSLQTQTIESLFNFQNNNSFSNQLKIAFNLIKSRDSLCLQLIAKSLEVFGSIKKQLNQREEKNNHLEKQIHEFSSKLFSASERIQQLEDQIQMYDKANEQQRRKVSEMQTKMQQNYKMFALEKQFSAKKEKKMQIHQEKEIENLIQDNQNLTKLLTSTQFQLNHLKESLLLKSKQLMELQDECRGLSKKLEYQKRQNEQLRRNVEEKQKFEKQKYQQETIDRKNSEDCKHFFLNSDDPIIPYEKFKSEIKFQKHNLKSQLNVSSIEPHNLFNFTDNIIGRSQQYFDDKKILNQEQVSLRRIHVDPYYAHFVLTSQSVKIKQDKQQYLNIDIKPYYSEIIEKRIPMHLWDQWIKNKLKEQYSRLQFFQIE